VQWAKHLWSRLKGGWRLLRRSVLENDSHMPKENETSMMNITNGDDHYFLILFILLK
jgi:hypothetical protein